MNANLPNDRARSFLLGTLSEDDRVRLEQEMFADPDRFDDILAAEEALIDEYIHDPLNPGSRWRLERMLAAHAGIRARVELARAARQAVRRARPAVNRSAARTWLPVAAALVLAVGSLLASAATFRDVVFVAIPAQVTRSTGHVARVRLHSRSAELRITIDVETDADTVDVLVVGPAGDEVTRVRAVPVTGTPPLRQAHITLRADGLIEGPHEIAMITPGLPPSHGTIAHCAFVVTRR
ncbi:MAG: hypothetical protein AB1806_19885 [Acidobacteriota bacterium]